MVPRAHRGQRPLLHLGLPPNHYVHYTANENYWQGAAKIKYLNINVLTSTQLLSGLQSGEIDLIQQTTGSILLEDYEHVKALKNATTYAGDEPVHLHHRGERVGCAHPSGAALRH